MKKIIFLLFFLVSLENSFGQSTYLDSLKTSLGKTSNLREKFSILEQLSQAFTIGIGNNSVADNFEMIKIAQQLKSDTLSGYAYYMTGVFYLYNKCDFNTGLDYDLKAIQYAETAKDTTTLVGALVDISMAYSNLKNTSEKFNFLKKAERNLPNKKNPDYNYLLSQVQGSYGLYYLNIKQPKLALQYLFAGKEAAINLNNLILDVIYQTYFGESYQENGDNELAEAYFKKAVAVSDSMQFPYIKYVAKNGYAGYLLSVKKYPEAKKQADDLLALGEASQNNLFKLKAAGYLKDIFGQQNKLDSGFFYANQALIFKDSVFNQENINKMQAMTFKEELRQQQIESDKIKSEEKRRQNIQFALIAFGIITFIIVFLLFSRSVVANEKLISFFGVLGLLVVFEFINLLLHPWLSSITHESPVLMLLALVLIASLLIPMHHKIEHWIKEKMVEKNKAIRLAAAKKTIEKLDKKNNQIN